MKLRQAHFQRVTKETRIEVRLKIDGAGRSEIRTGVAFFDHMLTPVRETRGRGPDPGL